MCQSSGCARTCSPSRSANACVMASTLSRSRPVGGIAIVGSGPQVRVTPARTRSRPESAAARAQRQQRRAGGKRGRRAEEVDRTPFLVMSRSASSATTPPALSRSCSVGTGRARAGERDHLHAERFAVGQEPLEQRLGLQPLGDGRERGSRAAPPRRRRGPSSPCGPSANAPPACSRSTHASPRRGRAMRDDHLVALMAGSRNASYQYRT